MASGPGRVKAETLRVSTGFERAGAPVAFVCDGVDLTGLAGESLAASLEAAGRAAYHPNGASAARGMFCGMGVCRECLVTVDGRPNVRACMTPLEAGMRVETTPGTVPGAGLPPDGAAKENVAECPDVLVVGGGPAGLHAALAAARAGARVSLLDERSSLGGQYFKPLAPSHRFASPPDRQFSEGLALVDAVRAAGVRCHPKAVVWAAFPGPELSVLVERCRRLFRPRRLVLATGAFERAVPVPGWTLPGLMTTGGAQALVRANRVTPGRRLVIAGNGPLNWQLAVELLAAGVDVAAVAESAPRFSFRGLAPLAKMLATDPTRTLVGAQMLAKLRGVLTFASTVIEVHGCDRVEAVTIVRIDDQGRQVAGTARRIEADAVCIGYGFIASCELARSLGCRHEPAGPGAGLRALRDADGRSSVPEVFIAGDGAGMGGAAAAQAEGAIAGAAAAADLGHAPAAVTETARAARRALQRHRRFQRALWSLFRAPPLTLQLADRDTLVCRCENVTLGTLREAVAQAELDIGSLKRQTRAGMGRCQGRYCGALLNEVIGRQPVDEYALFAPRPPARPVPIGLIAHERNEE